MESLLTQSKGHDIAKYSKWAATITKSYFVTIARRWKSQSWQDLIHFHIEDLWLTI